MLRRFWAQSKVTIVAEILLLIIVVLAVLGPYLTPYDPLEISLRTRLDPPSFEHPMGTDQVGRDLLSRMIAGTQITVLAVVLVLTIVSAIGITLGAIAAYVGGIVDDIVMRIGDLVLAFPALILAMALAAAMGASLTSAILAVALVRWPRYARLVRAQVLAFKNKPFVEAARAIGARPGRIVFRHILINALDPVLVRATVDAGYIILTTASLSFIGLGAQPPRPEWGVMVADGRSFLLNNPYLSIFPGIGIALAVFSFTIVGDALRDRLDPALRTLSGSG